MSLKTYLVNSRQKAVEAGRKAPVSEARDTSANLIKAVVLGANGSGFDVATLDGSGNPARIYQRVYPWPSDAALQAGDEVWLRLSGDGDSAEVVVSGTGSGGGSCYQAYSEWGVLFD